MEYEISLNIACPFKRYDENENHCYCFIKTKVKCGGFNDSEVPKDCPLKKEDIIIKYKYKNDY